MLKELKDYLHLYLNSGCKVQYEYFFTTQEGSELREAELIGLSQNGITKFVDLKAIDKHGNISSTGTFRKNINNIKPILRPLSDMTQEESLQADKIHLSAHYSDTPNITVVAEYTRFLLSKYFDLFGLIESGHAIDKTTL